MSDTSLETSEITEEFLLDVIKASHTQKDIKITHYSVDLANPTGKNFICTVFRAKVTFTLNSCETEHDEFIIKVVPHNAMSRKFALEENRVVEKERNAYTVLLPKMNANRGHLSALSVPKYYFSKITQDSGVVVLEDLCKFGYQLGDISQGFDLDHCKLVMEEIGKFHALSYAVKDDYLNDTSGELRDMGRESNFTEYVKGVFSCVLREGVKSAFSLAYPIINDKETCERLEKFLESTDVYDVLVDGLKPSEPYATLCHGDYWANNIMFRYETRDGVTAPVQMKMIDFQFVRYALPTSDLVWFFYTSTTLELRQNHLTKLLRLYHESLTAALKSLNRPDLGFTFDTLLELYHQSSLAGIVFASFVLGSVLTESVDDVVLNDAQTPEDYVKLSKEMNKKMTKTQDNTNMVNRIHGVILDALDMKIV